MDPHNKGTTVEWTPYLHTLKFWSILGGNIFEPCKFITTLFSSPSKKLELELIDLWHYETVQKGFVCKHAIKLFATSQNAITMTLCRSQTGGHDIFADLYSMHLGHIKPSRDLSQNASHRLLVHYMDPHCNWAKKKLQLSVQKTESVVGLHVPTTFQFSIYSKFLLIGKHMGVDKSRERYCDTLTSWMG